MLRPLLLITLLLSLLSGCGKNKDPSATPERAAKAFLTAIYVDRDIEAALRLAGPDIAETLRHYRTPAMIQRHVMALRLTTARFKISDVNRNFFRNTAGEVVIAAHISGDFHGEPVIDDRLLTLTMIGPRWIVTQLKTP